MKEPEGYASNDLRGFYNNGITEVQFDYSFLGREVNLSTLRYAGKNGIQKIIIDGRAVEFTTGNLAGNEGKTYYTAAAIFRNPLKKTKNDFYISVVSEKASELENIQKIIYSIKFKD